MQHCNVESLVGVSRPRDYWITAIMGLNELRVRNPN